MLLRGMKRARFSTKSVEQNELIDQVLARIETDRNFLAKVLEKAPNDQVAHRIVRPIASHVGKVLDSEFAKADLDGNLQLSAVELQNWYKQKYPSYTGVEGALAGMREKSGGGGGGAAAASSKVDAAAASSVIEPSKTQLRQLAVMAGIPFIGFGILDNAIMLTAGSQIEASMGVAFGITPLFAAGLGNAVSDVAGLKAGGAIEILAARLGLPDPGLTAAQLKLSSVKRTTLLAGAMGLTVGCLLGMFPLLFIDEHHMVLREIFDDIDVDKSGTISEVELEQALSKLGIDKSEVHKLMSMADLDKNNSIDFEEFKKLAKIVKDR